MTTLQPAEGDMLNAQEPWTQSKAIGTRLLEEAGYGLLCFKQFIPAGTAGVVTPLQNPGSNKLVGTVQAPARPDIDFDFEVVDIVVRTESAVASSTIQAKQGATAMSDAIISAALNAITRMGTCDPTKSKFFPASNPAGYAAAPLNLVDAGGATAAARTVWIYVRRIGWTG